MDKIKIGIVSPASSIIGDKGMAEFNKGVKKIENAGFEVIIGKNVFSNTNSNCFCGSIEEKLNDIYEVASKAKYIIFSTGGINSNVILDYLDYEKIKNNVFIGNSNPTLLLNAFYKMNNNISYIGPNVKSLGKSDSMFSVKCLKEKIINNNKEIFVEKQNIIINKGTCKGIAIGGNIQSLRRIIGTKFFPESKNCILYLEASNKETNECEFESIIHQFRQAEILKNIKGIILGDYGEHIDFYKKIFKDFTIPILVCNNLGHGVNNNLLPLGKEIMIVDDKIIEC